MVNRNWSHPAYGLSRFGTLAPARETGFWSAVTVPPGYYRKPQKKTDVVSFFLISSSTAVVFTLLVLVVSFLNSSVPQIIGLETPVQQLTKFFSNGKDDFLSAISREKKRELSGQVHYVTQIIGANKQSDSTAKSLALSIVEESYKANYDPLLIAAVIKSESTFKKQARSGVGARGLMQIMPETGQFIAKLQRDRWQGESKLHDPRYNLELGIAYLKHLQNMFNGNLTYALIAYNWGPGNLLQALEKREHIPTSTIQYARRIITDHNRWKEDFKSKKGEYQYMNIDYL